MTTCPSCRGARLRSARIRETMRGVDLGDFETSTCPACGESFLDEDAVATLEERARAAGIWGARDSSS